MPNSFLRFDGEFHRQLAEDFLAEAADDHVDRVFLGDAARLAVENLVLADLRRRRFVLDLGGRVLDFEIRERVRAAAIADQQRVALRVVARVAGVLADLDRAAIGVLAAAGRDALRDDRAARVLAQVDHLGAGVGLLEVVGDGDRIELADRIVALQDAARILPRHRGAGLDLRPGDLRAIALADAALGDEVVDAALAVLVAGVPVLDRRVLDGRVLVRDELDDRGVQLVLVALRRRAAFEVADRRALVGDDQRPLELAGVLRVDAEVGRQLHRAAHALRDVDEAAVAEHRGVERREVVVGVRHDRADVLLHQVGMILHRFGERAEDDAELGQLAAERRRHRHRVEHRIDGDVREQLLLLERDAELVEGRADFRIDLVEAVELLLLRRRGVVAHALVVDRLVRDVLPVRLFHLEPRAERLEAPLEQPLGLALLRRDQAHHVFIEADRDDVLLGVGDEPVLVFGIRQFFDLLGCCAHKVLRS